MEGTEDLGNVLLTLIAQVVILVSVFGILYFTAYKPIKRMINKYLQQNGKKEAQIDSKSQDETKQVKFDYISEANKAIKNIEDRAAQANSNIQQGGKEENMKVLESIISKAKAQIGEERDIAIDKLKEEYVKLVIQVTDNDINNLDKKESKRKRPKSKKTTGS